MKTELRLGSSRTTKESSMKIYVARQVGPVRPKQGEDERYEGTFIFKNTNGRFHFEAILTDGQRVQFALKKDARTIKLTGRVHDFLLSLALGLIGRIRNHQQNPDISMLWFNSTQSERPKQAEFVSETFSISSSGECDIPDDICEMLESSEFGRNLVADSAQQRPTYDYNSEGEAIPIT